LSAFTIIVGGRTKGSVGMSLVNLGEFGLNGRELEKLGGGHKRWEMGEGLAIIRKKVKDIGFHIY
jgi:hypothetical protein